jgi:hypothetical protein
MNDTRIPLSAYYTSYKHVKGQQLLSSLEYNQLFYAIDAYFKDRLLELSPPDVHMNGFDVGVAGREKPRISVPNMSRAQREHKGSR